MPVKVKAIVSWLFLTLFFDDMEAQDRVCWDLSLGSKPRIKIPLAEIIYYVI